MEKDTGLSFNTEAQLAKVKFDEEMDEMLVHLEAAYCRPAAQSMYYCMADCNASSRPGSEMAGCLSSCKTTTGMLKRGISDEIKKLLDYQRADFDHCAEAAEGRTHPTKYFSDCVKHRLEIHGELLGEIVENVAEVAAKHKS